MEMTNFTQQWRLAGGLFILTQIVGCGGGGGGGGGSTNVPTAPANQAPEITTQDRSLTEGRSQSIPTNVIDRDGTIASIEWVQLSGPPVVLENPTEEDIRFTVPFFDQGSEFTLRITAVDDLGASSSAEALVTIEPIVETLATDDDGYSYRSSLGMSGASDYATIEIPRSGSYTITLRSFLGNTDLFLYADEARNAASLIASSTELDLSNDQVELDATAGQTVFVRIDGEHGDQWTLTIREPSAFLEPGFPVEMRVSGGSNAGNSRRVRVANIDSDDELEIVLSSVSQGPVYAFNHDGSNVPGWPVQLYPANSYITLANFDGDPAFEVAAGRDLSVATCSIGRFLLDGNANIMPGWPPDPCNRGEAVVLDLTGDGVAELVYSAEDKLFADGSSYSAYTPPSIATQPPRGRSFADITGDGQLEMAFMRLRNDRSLIYDVYAVDADGNDVAGFPTTVDLGLQTFNKGGVALPDFDLDGAHELVRIMQPNTGDELLFIDVFDSDGSLLWQQQTTSKGNPSTEATPAFGDLTGDGQPELVLQTEGEVYAWQGDGSIVSGYPVAYATTLIEGIKSDSGPLIGDVTGDNAPNLVVAARSEIIVMSAFGVVEQRIPFPRNDTYFAIADIDLDGRNEIIAAVDWWNGLDNERVASIWVFDLGGASHGPVVWGQHSGSPAGNFVFPIP